MRTLIENGLVVDPANRIQSRLHLLIEDGRIASLTESVPAGEFRRIDAAGKVVCPGFLDIHMHEAPLQDLSDPEGSIFGMMLRMGVTTVLGGNCGDSALPPPRYWELVRAGLPVNLCMLAPHGAAREAAGFRDKYAPLTAEEIPRVAEVLAEYLDWGCWGISYGIRYYPGMDMPELMETARLCRDGGLLVAAHVRDDAAYIYSALEEFLAPGFAYGLKMQVSHLGSMAGYGQMDRVLSMLDDARSRGLDVMADSYPYSAFSTDIGSCTYDPGFLERYHCDYSDVKICEGPYKDMVCTKELFDDMRKNYPGVITVAHVMDPGEVERALCHPAVMLCSDGVIHGGQGHPRAAGSFPRFLSEYVRQGKLSLSEALEKMTSLPARRIGLPRKGNLSVGSDGDVVIFDAETIRDRATFREPGLAPEGIDYVLLGGEVVCDHGRILDPRRGRFLRRGHMSSDL